MKNKIITSIIGTGTHAYTWASEIKKNNNYVIKNVSSRSSERGKKFANFLNVEFVEDIKKISNNSNIHLVVICSSPDRNILAIDLAKHKKNLILEKPLALNITDCDQIRSACKENGIICAAGLNRNYDTFFSKLDEHLKKMGNIISGEYKAFFSTKDIEKNIRKVGGIFLSKLVHNFDQCNKIFGLPEDVVATKLIDKNLNIIIGSHIMIRYSNNKIVNFNINLNNKNRFGEVLLLYCENGIIVVNFNLWELSSIVNPLNYKYSRFILGNFKSQILKLKKIPRFNKKKNVLTHNFWPGGKQDILNDFYKAIKNKDYKNFVNIDNNYISTKMALACEKSINKKAWVNLNNF